MRGRKRVGGLSVGREGRGKGGGGVTWMAMLLVRQGYYMRRE